MEIQPIDVNALVGEIFGIALLMIPVLGFTLRWAIKPVIEAYARAFPSSAKLELELERLTRRVQELEDAAPPRELARVEARELERLPPASS